MLLWVVHHHLRPGGVRRVIETALPGLLADPELRIQRVLLLTGEAPDSPWLEGLSRALDDWPLEVRVEPGLRYQAEQRLAPPAIARRIRTALLAAANELPTGEAPVIWYHNPSLARTPQLTREILRFATPRNLPVVFHHHDWWFDNRWQRWPELRRAGFTRWRSLCQLLLPAQSNVRHAVINQQDSRALRAKLPGRVAWLPNPGHFAPAPSSRSLQRARSWLRDQIPNNRPIWLLPCRLLRRKNIAEALLLMRWLRPEALLVTTAGVSSADELPYATALADAARSQGWPLRLGLVAAAGASAPAVADLLGVSEAIVLTSLVEGFGLPFLEATQARRPLLARRLPNVAPDLQSLGLRIPYHYRETWVAPVLFDFDAERRRQEVRFRQWQRRLPRSVRNRVGTPLLLTHDSLPRRVPFSRLTLRAQLEILGVPAEQSWRHCQPLNAHLPLWREEAQAGALQPAEWPAMLETRLGPKAYARRFRQLLQSPARAPEAPEAAAGEAATERLLEHKLAADNLYPLLWTTEP